MNTWHPIIVINKATGEKMTIKDIRFDSRLHQYVGAVLEEKPLPVDLSSVIPALKLEEEKTEVPVALEGEARFKELKQMRAWLKPELKAEYEQLKSLYGKKAKDNGADTPPVPSQQETTSL